MQHNWPIIFDYEIHWSEFTPVFMNRFLLSSQNIDTWTVHSLVHVRGTQLIEMVQKKVEFNPTRLKHLCYAMKYKRISTEVIRLVNNIDVDHTLAKLDKVMSACNKNLNMIKITNLIIK